MPVSFEVGGQNSYKGITILDSYVVLLKIMFNVHDSTHATYLSYTKHLLKQVKWHMTEIIKEQFLDQLNYTLYSIMKNKTNQTTISHWCIS